jgi:hypothetical protein
MNKKLNLLMAILLMSCSTFAQNQLVTFQVENPTTTPVYVFGSWNWGGWPGTAMSLVAPGKYSASLSLPQSATYEYLFVRDSLGNPVKETLDPTWTCTNGNSTFTNRVFNLGTADTGLCYTWATCNTCTVSPPPSPINVTFQVESPDSTPVYVQGSWNWASFPGANMTLSSGTTYTTTLQLMPYSNYEFKYNNGVGPTFELLDPTWPCTNGNSQYTNRTLALGGTDTTICFKWSTCTPCTITPPPANINVKFAVQASDSTPVYVFGNWNNWNNFPGAPMTLNTATGNYEATVVLPENSTIEYLFVNGTSNKEKLDSAWSCTNHNAQFTNRLATLGSSDTTLCNRWASCLPCFPLSITNLANDIENILINNNSIIINSKTLSKVDNLIIYDAVGKVVYASNGEVNTNQNITVNLQNNALYIISVSKSNSYFKTKAIIQ